MPLFPDGPGTLNEGVYMAFIRSALALLRRSQVEADSGLLRSTLYLRISQGLWTKPVLIGPRAVGWPAGEVDALNRARIAGKGDDAIRELVVRLEAARTGADRTTATEAS